MVLVCVDALCPYQDFLVVLGRFPVFLGCTSPKHRIKCLAEGHKPVPLVCLELATSHTLLLNQMSRYPKQVLFCSEAETHFLNESLWSVVKLKQDSFSLSLKHFFRLKCIITFI